MALSGGRHVRLDTARRGFSGRAGEMPHGFEEDLFQRVPAVRELSHQEALPGDEAPDGVHLDSRRQDDPPAAETFGYALGAARRQPRAQVPIVAGDFELDEGAVRPPLFLEIALMDDRA